MKQVPTYIQMSKPICTTTTAQLPSVTAIRLYYLGSHKHSTISPLQVRERGLALSALTFDMVSIEGHLAFLRIHVGDSHSHRNIYSNSNVG